MYELKLSKPARYRVKEGQTSSQIAKVFGCPVPANVACGDVIRIFQGELSVYSARVGDTYATIAAKFKVNERELATLNGEKAIYPTCKIFLPARGGQ